MKHNGQAKTVCCNIFPTAAEQTPPARICDQLQVFLSGSDQNQCWKTCDLLSVRIKRWWKTTNLAITTWYIYIYLYVYIIAPIELFWCGEVIFLPPQTNGGAVNKAKCCPFVNRYLALQVVKDSFHQQYGCQKVSWDPCCQRTQKGDPF